MNIDKTIEFYKIRRADGCFSGGGFRPSFSKKGKTWLRLSDVMRHLSELSDVGKQDYAGCELISTKYELKSTDVCTITSFVASMEDASRKRFEAKVARQKAAQEAVERREYERLRAKFDSLRGDPD